MVLTCHAAMEHHSVINSNLTTSVSGSSGAAAPWWLMSPWCISLSETSAVSALFLHVLIWGVFCIDLLFNGVYGNTTSYFSFQSALFEPLASYTSMEVVVGNCEQQTWGSSWSFRWVVPSFEPRTFGGREIRMVRITLETGPGHGKPSRSAALTQPGNENLVQSESIFG